MVTLHFGAERVVAMFGYDTIKEALVDHGDEFVWRGNLPIFDKVKKGQGILCFFSWMGVGGGQSEVASQNESHEINWL